jgi:hypothetical protein
MSAGSFRARPDDEGEALVHLEHEQLWYNESGLAVLEHPRPWHRRRDLRCGTSLPGLGRGRVAVIVRPVCRKLDQGETMNMSTGTQRVA